MKLILTEKQFKNLVEMLTEENPPAISGLDSDAIKGIGALANLYNNPLQTIIEKLPPEVFQELMKQWDIKTDNTSTLNKIPSDGKQFIHPLGDAQKYGVVSKYLTARSTGMHKGVDIPAKTGTPVYAPSDGVVLNAGDVGGRCGGFVKLQHKNNITKYCHLSKWFVSKGQNIKQGTIIGNVGGGANDPYKGSSTGSHLHYEVLTLSNEHINPQQPQFGFA
jgi:murein DD-endopeptidase MepM/ murein hydrolase activator NlpD